MTKKSVWIVVSIFLGIFSLVCMAFKESPHTFQYMSIITTNNDLDNVFVSIDGKEYKVMHFQRQSKGHWDLNPVINLMHQYEIEGWQVEQVSTGGNMQTFWLKKEK